MVRAQQRVKTFAVFPDEIRRRGQFDELCGAERRVLVQGG
jgi:hypothetical protein